MRNALVRLDISKDDGSVALKIAETRNCGDDDSVALKVSDVQQM